MREDIGGWKRKRNLCGKQGGEDDHEMMCLMKQAGRETSIFTFPGGTAWLSDLQRFYYSHCRVLEISVFLQWKMEASIKMPLIIFRAVFEQTVLF